MTGVRDKNVNSARGLKGKYELRYSNLHPIHLLAVRLIIAHIISVTVSVVTSGNVNILMLRLLHSADSICSESSDIVATIFNDGPEWIK